MPITIKSTELKYKNPSTGNYQGIDAVAETTTSQQCALIEAKGVETRASIPSDYTTLSDTVDNLNSAIISKADFLNTIYHDSLKGKKISIIGDSISTYDQTGYKVNGYAMYYPNASIEGIADVDSVDKTWWKQILNLTGATIEVNASYSASCVTNVLSGQGYPDFYDRCTAAILGNPDIIIVALGTNDSSQAVPIGDFDYTTAYTSLDESTFSNAYIKGIKALQTNFPNAEIICVSLYMNPWYVNAIHSIASYFGLTYIDANPYQGGYGSHPGALGMKQIALNVLAIRGAQTNIKGTRTFVNGLVCFGQHILLYGDMDASKTPSSNTGLPYIAFRDYNNKYLSTIRGWKYADGSGFMRFSGNNILPDNSEYGNALDVGALVDGKPFIRVACDYGSNSTKKQLNAKHAWQTTLLTPEEVSITQTSPLPSNVSSVSNLNVIQSGYVVEICMMLTLSASSSSWQAIASGLPKPNPNITIYFTPQISYDSTVNALASKPLQLRLNNQGVLGFRNGYAATFGFTFTYITSDDPSIVS